MNTDLLILHTSTSRSQRMTCMPTSCSKFSTFVTIREKEKVFILTTRKQTMEIICILTEMCVVALRWSRTCKLSGQFEPATPTLSTIQVTTVNSLESTGILLEWRSWFIPVSVSLSYLWSQPLNVQDIVKGGVGSTRRTNQEWGTFRASTGIGARPLYH